MSNPESEHPVVACYSGTDAVGAVQLGERLAVAVQQPLIIASAYRYEPVALSARAVLADDNQRRFGHAEYRVARAHRLVSPGVDVQERVVPAVSVADALIELAGEVDACVIVLGPDVHGHVTRSVLQHAPCPVAVSPFTVAVPGEGAPRRIGVAYDGSPASRTAVTAAAALARAVDAEITLLSASTADRFPPDRLEVADRVDAGLRDLHGDAADVLVAASADLDLLYCGSRGRGPTAAFVLGSVSGELVTRAHCPVVAIPPRVRRRPGPMGVTTAEELTVRAGR